MAAFPRKSPEVGGGGLGSGAGTDVPGFWLPGEVRAGRLAPPVRARRELSRRVPQGRQREGRALEPSPRGGVRGGLAPQTGLPAGVLAPSRSSSPFCPPDSCPPQRPRTHSFAEPLGQALLEALKSSRDHGGRESPPSGAWEPPVSWGDTDHAPPTPYLSNLPCWKVVEC